MQTRHILTWPFCVAICPAIVINLQSNSLVSFLTWILISTEKKKNLNDLRPLCRVNIQYLTNSTFLLRLLTASVLYFKPSLALKLRSLQQKLAIFCFSLCLEDHIKSEHAMPAEDLPLLSLHEQQSCLFKYAHETLSWGTTAHWDRERGGARRKTK